MAEQNEDAVKTCTHYSRACSLVAPCCNKTYECRLCHDEKESHEIDRFSVKQIQCRKCSTVQPVAESCVQCSVRFARYFCSVCNLYDDAEKGQYHCSKCGICRIGGKDNFIHCDTCGLCLQVTLSQSHKCVQEASRSNCPVCMEDIHTSRNPAHVPDCGHLLHKKCFTEMLENGLYQCPQCQTSLIKMSSHWDNMDSERQRWILPPQLRDFKVKIQCRDCRKDSESMFHFIGLKCCECGSYNTVRNGSETLPLEDVDPSMPMIAHDEEELYMLDPMGLLAAGLELQPTPSTDSEDEYETPSSPGLSEEEQDELEYPEQILGGIPLLPPWLPQHSENLDINFLTNHLPMFLNIEDDGFDDLENDHHLPNGNWEHPADLSPYVQLANSLLPTSLFGGGHDSGVPHVWEMGGATSDEEGETGVGSDGWETASEEEVIGGDEEDLGKGSQISLQEEESSQLGGVAPAD